MVPNRRLDIMPHYASLSGLTAPIVSYFTEVPACISTKPGALAFIMNSMSLQCEKVLCFDHAFFLAATAAFDTGEAGRWAGCRGAKRGGV